MALRIRYTCRMASTATLLTTARSYSGFSARRLAAVAGVSPSTVTRIERGELDPTVTTFERILGACGYRYGDRLVPNIDLEAVRAARLRLDPDCGLTQTAASIDWCARWTRAGLLESLDPLTIAALAARQATLLDRPGAVSYRTADWRRVTSALSDSGQTWALTGGRAAAFYTRVATVDWSVFYVDDVRSAAERAGLERSDNAQAITLIPFDEVTSRGVQLSEGGIYLADFWQIVIDCLAGDGRMPAQADAMLDLVAAR